MKRVLIVALLSLGLLGCTGTGAVQQLSSISQPEPEKQSSSMRPDPTQTEFPDFRNVKWGMSKSQVKESEQALDIYSETEEILTIITTHLSYTVLCSFIFEADKLKSAGYSIPQGQIDWDMHLDAYNSLVDLYTKEYGEPSSQEVTWIDPTHKELSEATQIFEPAVSMGHLSFLTAWKTSKSIVGISLCGEDLVISLAIIYMAA